MKTIILILFLSLNLFAQNHFLTLMQGDRITYNGDELLADDVDKNLEPIDIYASDFSTNADGWANIQGTISDNNDGIYGKDNVAKILGNGGAYSYLINNNITVDKRFAGYVEYFVPSAASTATVRFLFGATGTAVAIAVTKGAWTTIRGITNCGTSTQARINFNGTATGDSVYFTNYKVSRVFNYTAMGNHSVDTSSTVKQAGNYSCKIVSTNAGNGTTNTISLASTLFTAVTNGTNYRFQIYAYSPTTGTTLTFKLGDIVLTKDVSTSGMSVLNFDFKATASTTGNILLYLNQAATVYIDEASLKSGQ